MDTPTHTDRTRPIRPLLSVRLAAAVVALVIAGLFSLFAWDTVHQSRQIDSLVRSLHSDDAAVAVADSNQQKLLDYVAAIESRDAALVAYLHNHGIKIPVRYISPIRPPHLRSVPGVRSAPRVNVQRHRHHGHKRHPRAPKRHGRGHPEHGHGRHRDKGVPWDVHKHGKGHGHPH